MQFYLGDPYPIYARLRKEAPVFWCEAGNFWALSKYEDIAWVEGQPNPPFTTVDGLFIPDAANPARTAERDPGGARRRVRLRQRPTPARQFPAPRYACVQPKAVDRLGTKDKGDRRRVA